MARVPCNNDSPINAPDWPIGTFIVSHNEPNTTTPLQQCCGHQLLKYYSCYVSCQVKNISDIPEDTTAWTCNADGRIPNVTFNGSDFTYYGNSQDMSAASRVQHLSAGATVTAVVAALAMFSGFLSL